MPFCGTSGIEVGLCAALRHAVQDNARVWAGVFQDGRVVEGRRIADTALVRAMGRHHPRRVLDVGDGTGWVDQLLASTGVVVTAVDVQTLVTGPTSGVDVTGFDLVVFDGSLDGKPIAPILRSVHRMLAPTGAIVVRTEHAGGRDVWHHAGQTAALTLLEWEEPLGHDGAPAGVAIATLVPTATVTP